MRLRPSLKLGLSLTFTLFTLGLSPRAFSFCGFYVGKADSKLFNQASQVALARDGDKTVMTMANDFQGELKEFAVVIPVPTVIKKEQIHIADKALIDHLDAYTAPRLVEYFDENPCQVEAYRRNKNNKVMFDALPAPMAAGSGRARSLGVTIEAQYTVGEYDILILSALQSNGLEIWLKENGYKLPEGASKVLGSYIKQNMKFFVAKVNLKEQGKLGYSYLRPIQVAYESPKFMLPIRLGTVNAKGPQDLLIYTLTRQGRVETLNYRTTKLPSDMDLPLYVKEGFGEFYKAMFNEQVKKEDMRTVFLEYAWNMNACDPCSADPLSPEELKNAGVFWLNDGTPTAGVPTPMWRQPPGGSPETFITRLHLRYDREHFPEDLVFQETSNQESFQGRYVLRHPWTGNDQCKEAKEYQRELPQRFEKEAQSLANLTGWDIQSIRDKLKLSGQTPEEKKWYEKIWN